MRPTHRVTARLGALVLGVASVSAVGCQGDDAHDRPVSITEPLRIEASPETKSAIGVAVWGASSAGANAAIRGYSPSGEPVVALSRRIAHGDGAYQVIFAIDGRANADMAVEVAANSDQVVVARNRFGNDAMARSVVDHLAQDVAKYHASQGVALTQSHALSIVGQGSTKLVDCVNKLVEKVTSLVDSLKSCLVVSEGGSGCSGANVADEAKQAVQQAGADAQQCAAGAGGEQGGSGGGPGGGNGASNGGSNGASNGGSNGGGMGGMPGMPEIPGLSDALKCIPKDPSFWLPMMSGVAAMVSQAPNGQLTHDTPDSKDGVDFALPAGAPVTAMTGGVVLMASGAVKAGMPCWDGGGPECRDTMNYVIVGQQDGTDSLYAHLATIAVKAGDAIEHGQVLGTVGSTGESTGPHLHVQRQERCGKVTCPTLPLSFGSTEDGGTPTVGKNMEQCQ